MTSTVLRLTRLSHGAGCGCKLSADDLEAILRGLDHPTPPALLVGPATADDAGVYRVRPDLALVQTADFFTPIVDDAYSFGRIAAANALSDVYAMGGEPLTALNLLAAPLDDLGHDVVRQILRGGADAVAEAGATIVGGHSIDDPEPKYGLAVTGTVHPDRILTNAAGRPGDALVLSKPLGVGAICTAARRDAEPAGLAEATAVMAMLNRDASRAALAAGAHGATDVTGFGLLGHLGELCLASGVGAEISASAVPVIAGALELIAHDAFWCGGSVRNRRRADPLVTWEDAVDEPMRRMLSDAMTSGGLLVAVAAGRAADELGAVIGTLTTELEPGRIRVTA